MSKRNLVCKIISIVRGHIIRAKKDNRYFLEKFVGATLTSWQKEALMRFSHESKKELAKRRIKL